MTKKLIEHLKNKIVWGIAAGVVVGLCVAQYILLPIVMTPV